MKQLRGPSIPRPGNYPAKRKQRACQGSCAVAALRMTPVKESSFSSLERRAFKTGLLRSYSHPFARAILDASTRLAAPTLLMASDR